MKMHCKSAVFSLCTILTFMLVSKLTVHAGIYVSTNGNHTTGANWDDAFNNVQTAIDVATNGATIYVAGHTFDLTNALNWVGQTNVHILGGYEGVSGAPGTRDTDLYHTIIRRDADAGDFRVLDIDSVTGGRLDGLTIADGDTEAVNARPAPGSGAGIRLIDSSLTLDRCVISNNIARATSNGYAWGGGMYAVNSDLIVTNTLFVGNVACNTSTANNGRTLGAGLAADGGTVTVVHSEFIDNEADSRGHVGSWGGGIYMVNATGWVRDTLIAGNRVNPHADRHGGRYGFGGGIYINSGTLVENCTIVSNRSYNTYPFRNDSPGGGGVYINGGTLRNSLIHGNRALNEGGGIVADNGDIESVTVSGNYSDSPLDVTGLGVHLSGNASLVNAIVFGNRRYADGKDVSMNETGGTVTYSCIMPLRSGTGNTDIEPQFANAAAGDFRLLPGSPAIDSADELAWMASATDLDGNPRIRNAVPDMGAYESEPLDEGNLRVNFVAAPDQRDGLDKLTVEFTAYAHGADSSGLSYSWDFENDGNFDIEDDDQQVVTHEFGPGIHTVRLVVENASNETAERIKPDYITVLRSELYVWTGGNDSNGSSWDNAFHTIQQAIDAAAVSNTIYLAGETFDLTEPLYWHSHQGVQILGGYEAEIGTVGPGDYDADIWPTLIRRDDAAGDIRVIALTGVFDGKLARVTIANGSAYTGSGTMRGGGMHILNSVVEIVECVISNNISRASGNDHAWGGGVYAEDATVAFIRTRFVGNSARNDSSTNNGRTLGGGLAALRGSITVLNCEFIDNDSDGVGHHGCWGGGMYLTDGTGLVRNSLFTGNRARPRAGGSGRGYIGRGGAVYLTDGTVMENVTVANNKVWNSGSYGYDTTAGGIFAAGGVVSNSVVYHNTEEDIGVSSDVNSDGLDLFFWSCAPELTNEANNNITDNPLFADVETDNFRLSEESPCVDTGNNADWMAAATDLDGDPRILQGRPDRSRSVDRGAYEKPPLPGTFIMVR